MILIIAVLITGAAAIIGLLAWTRLRQRAVTARWHAARLREEAARAAQTGKTLAGQVDR